MIGHAKGVAGLDSFIVIELLFQSTFVAFLNTRSVVMVVPNMTAKKPFEHFNVFLMWSQIYCFLELKIEVY